MQSAVPGRYSQFDFHDFAARAVAVRRFEIQSSRTCVYGTAMTKAPAAFARRTTAKLEMNINSPVSSLLNHRSTSSIHFIQFLLSKVCTKHARAPVAHINNCKFRRLLNLSGPGSKNGAPIFRLVRILLPTSNTDVGFGQHSVKRVSRCCFFSTLFLTGFGALVLSEAMPVNSDVAGSATQTSLLSSQAETERLAAIGKFTAKVAHELNNPLDGILRYISLASRSVESGNPEKLNEYLAHSQRGILRMVKIVRELLEFSRCHYLPVEEAVALEQIIEDAIKACAAKDQTPAIQITRLFEEDLPKFPAANLFQIFCNLIKNAFEAMPDGGTLEIAARTESSGNTVVEFRDSGCGFDPQQSDAIFEPFFTTKTQGRGTGLGLAICKDLIERHGGRITAHNRPLRGSVFRVVLPGPAAVTK